MPFALMGRTKPALLFIDLAWSKTPLFSQRKNGAMLSTSYPDGNESAVSVTGLLSCEALSLGCGI